MTLNAPLEVVAAAITDPRGRILLTRRTAGRELAGLWEFPGGKREPGETPEQALVRELEEELGIQVQVGAPLIAVPQRYPNRRLRLDVRRVSAWKGTPKGHEGQALAWVPAHKLASYAMPPADIPVVAALTQPDRYLVTPAPGEDGLPVQAHDPVPDHVQNQDRPTGPGPMAGLAGIPGQGSAPRHGEAPAAGADSASAGERTPAQADARWLAGIERALAAGIRRLYLRLPEQPGERTVGAGAGPPGEEGTAADGAERPRPPGIPADRREALIRQAVALAQAAGAEAFIGGDIELARATGAGLHLRAAQLPLLQQRPLPAGFPLAASCHDEAELRHAQRLGCDFAVLGPLAPTATHPGAPGIGWPGFSALRETVSLPIYAIGGLAPADIPESRRHGAQGIAAIRSLWPA